MQSGDGRPPRASEGKHLLLALLLLYVAPWAIYALLLARQPADPFDAWHGLVAWPADHFLAETQGGLLMPIFGHLMIGLVGGLFLATLVAGLARLLAPLLGRDLGGPAGALVLVLAPLWAFAFMKAVPARVTVLDPDAPRLEVHTFQRFLLYPTGTRVLRGDQLAALYLDSYWHKRTGDRFLGLYALDRGGEAILLGERPCLVTDVDPCLAEGGDDLRRLAAWLGTPGAVVDTATRPGVHFIALAAPRPTP